jgi:hypothetical protein
VTPDPIIKIKLQVKRMALIRVGCLWVLFGTIPFVAVFLDSAGHTHSPTYGSSIVTDAGGSMISISADEDADGNVYVAGVDHSYNIWLNILSTATQTWRGWVAVPGFTALFPPVPQIAVAPGNLAYIVADALNCPPAAYLSTPVARSRAYFTVAAAPDGSIYVYLAAYPNPETLFLP